MARITYNDVKAVMAEIKELSSYDSSRSYLTNWSDGKRRYVSYMVTLTDRDGVGHSTMIKADSVTTREAYSDLNMFLYGFEQGMKW